MTKISFNRLLHYIYTLQNRRSVTADLTAFIGYVDALKDNEILDKRQACAVIEIGLRVHRHLLTHCEPYKKIPYNELKTELTKILNIEMEETT